jgi:hypothetical protein
MTILKEIRTDKPNCWKCCYFISALVLALRCGQRLDLYDTERLYYLHCPQNNIWGCLEVRK